VLVANLGTPAAPTSAAVRRFLREFLLDPKVVDLPRVPWRALLELAILPRRASRVARTYASIWTAAGSPLAVRTQAIASGLAARLGPGFDVRVGMRYGAPSLQRAVAELAAAGCERVALLPLFPQWSDTTSGTLQEATARALARLPNAPALTVVPPYYDDEGYLEALAGSARAAVAGADVERWLFSFHGLPERYVRRGDPYLDHCQRTAWALAARLDLPAGRWELVFQSRFGREPWLVPDLDGALERAGREGLSTAVVQPGFLTDGLETLAEVAREGRARFAGAGGRELWVVPPLNEAQPGVVALEGVLRRAAGW